MSSKLFRILIAAAAVVIAAPAVVRAEIYTWRDSGGNLVLSDRPKDGGERTYAVGTTGDIRTTRATKRNAAYDPIITEHARRTEFAPIWCAR